MSVPLRTVTALAALSLIAACGGGGGGGAGADGNGSGGGPPAGGSYTPGVFQLSSSFAAQCASPRTGINPNTGRPYPDRQGSVTDENNFLRSWTHELYLWYREVPDQNPAGFTTLDYFDQLVTPEKTASGRPKDRFHFTFDTAAFEALSQSGVSVGYGAQWFILAPSPPRRVVVAYVEPGSPAGAAGVALVRGAEVVRADGVDVVNDGTGSGVNTLNTAFFPAAEGESHTFEIRDPGASVTRTVVLTAAAIETTPVLDVATIPTELGPVGYILFNDHIVPSEPALVNAVGRLRADNVVDLVLDIRYNGGGFLAIASELAYMVGGTNTVGRTFERMNFNDKHPSTNPVTGEPLTPMPFLTTTQFVQPAGRPLPTLNLPRVYVITGNNTCSASESIMNSLRGVGVEVHQIGSTTCGKPYGFYPQDNCGTTYFSIQFQGVNDQGFGDYPDGFSPQNTPGVRGVPLPGCSVADDFTRQLGDPSEARLAAALAYRASDNDSEKCPAASGSSADLRAKPGQPLWAADGVMYRSPLRENRILGDW